ncbi:MAG: hypothetical protein JWN01_1307 [Patescibacteria group bacterium]|nr:hypothetical protein [Patescibacteria group bacterium]
MPSAAPAAEYTTADFDITKGRFLPFTFSALVVIHLLAVWGFVRIASHPGIILDLKIGCLFLASLFVPLLAVTTVYHRGETHRGFVWRKDRWGTMCRSIGLTAAAASVQGHILKWSAVHRPHHTFVDRPGDAHSPRRYQRPTKHGTWRPTAMGVAWSHVIWLLYEYLAPPKAGYIDDPRDARTVQVRKRSESWVADLANDPVVRWHQRTYPIVVAARFLVPWLVAGWDGLLIAGFLAVTLGLHITWCTNSVAHMWGTFLPDLKQRHKAGLARNVFWWLLLWLLSFGEAWHNFHHRLENCVAHGWKWYHFDATKYTIWLLQWAKLITEVKWLRPQRNRIWAEEMEQVRQPR